MLKNMKHPSHSPFASTAARLTRRIRQRKQPVQRRSQATIEAILTATLQVLLTSGYPSLTTTRVASRAGVSVGTLYQYFPDKRSLVTALEVRYFERMIGAVREAVGGLSGQSLPGAGPGGSPASEETLDLVLRTALRALLHVKRDNLALTRALRTPLTEIDGGNFVRETLQQFVALLVPVVAGAMPGLPEVERRVTLLVAATEGAVSYAALESPDWLLEEWFLEDLTALGTRYLESWRGPETAPSIVRG
jgi:AcrR family transcriptional regulator